jgi:thymidylate synthase
MGLPPCHFSFHFVSKPQRNRNRKLHIIVNQRSADLFIGAVFNWTSYATLLALIAKLTGHEPGEVIWNGGDVHIYKNHFEQAKKVLELDKTYEPPSLKIDDINSLDDIDHSTVELVGYESGPFIKAPVAV